MDLTVDAPEIVFQVSCFRCLRESSSCIYLSQRCLYFLACIFLVNLEPGIDHWLYMWHLLNCLYFLVHLCRIETTGIKTLYWEVVDVVSDVVVSFRPEHKIQLIPNHGILYGIFIDLSEPILNVLKIPQVIFQGLDRK